MNEQKYEIKGGFFNSIAGDRKYNSEQMNKPYKRIITEGIFATPAGTPSTDLQVLSADDGMNIIVKAGDGLLGEKWFENTSDIVITVSTNTSIVPRIDSIIIQIDNTKTGRVSNIIYREGIASSNPEPPTINNVDNIVERRVANIRVNPDTSKIGQELITDLRGSSECPWITSLIKQVDTSTLFLQWQAAYKKYFDESTKEFEAWVEKLKGILDGDVAGNLLNEINKKAEQLKSDYDTKFNNLKSIVVAQNAGAHNAIYRGEDITDLFYDGTLSEQIANETFDNVFVGDYIIGQTSGRKYLVADINYRLNTGLDECITPHVLMIPEKIMGTAKMNDSATTEGAYIGSKMYRQYLEPFRKIIRDDFGENHILKHTNLFANAVTDGCESGGAWFYRDIELMNEQMLFGNNIFHNIQNGTKLAYNYTLDKQQLSLFKLRPCTIVARNDEGERFWYWLRDVASAYSFAGVGSDGCASANGASDTSDLDSGSDSNGVRPAFLVY